MSKPYIPKRFLGAFKAGHRASAREFIDEELSYKLLRKILNSNYSDLASMEALDYLTKFNNEYHKAVLKKGDPNALHNTDELYRDRTNANNARNRDILSIWRSTVFSLTPRAPEVLSGLGQGLTPADLNQNLFDNESALIDVLDAKNKMTSVI